MSYAIIMSTIQRRPFSIYYKFYPSTSSEIKSTLVLIHELGGTNQSWRSLTPMLSPFINILVFDLPDSGRSDRYEYQYDLLDLAIDINNLFKILDLKQYVIGGMAMGGIVAMYLTIYTDCKAAKLIICDGTNTITRTGRAYLRSRIQSIAKSGMGAALEESVRNSFGALISITNSAAVARYRKRFLNNDPAAYIRQSKALLTLKLPLIQLSRIRIPTLIMVGVSDTIFPPQYAYKISTLIRNSRYVEIQNAAHFPPIQNPRAACRSIVAFLT